jgi:hypothetical protein
VQPVVGWGLPNRRPGGDHSDELVLRADAPFGGRLACAGKVLEQVIRRSDRDSIMFIDEMHAVQRL